MAKANTYVIIGRYMDGATVTGYQMAINDTSGKRFSKETVCYLVGKGQVENCEGQMYKDDVLLRGVGIQLSSLPVVSDKDGTLSKTDNIGKVRRNTTPEQAMAQYMIVASQVRGHNTVGYILRNAGGIEKLVPRETVLTLAREGKIGNAEAQLYQGKLLLRGTNGTDLKKLPTQQIEAPAAELPQAVAPKAPRQRAVEPVVPVAPVRAKRVSAELTPEEAKNEMAGKVNHLLTLGIALQRDQALSAETLTDIMKPIPKYFSGKELSSVINAALKGDNKYAAEFATMYMAINAIKAQFGHNQELMNELITLLNEACRNCSVYPITKGIDENTVPLFGGMLIGYITDTAKRAGIESRG